MMLSAGNVPCLITSPTKSLAGKQGVVELGEVQLRDSGPDGTRGTTDDQRFAVQGIFLP